MIGVRAWGPGLCFWSKVCVTCALIGYTICEIPWEQTIHSFFSVNVVPRSNWRLKTILYVEPGGWTQWSLQDLPTQGTLILWFCAWKDSLTKRDFYIPARFCHLIEHAPHQDEQEITQSSYKQHFICRISLSLAQEHCHGMQDPSAQTLYKYFYLNCTFARCGLLLLDYGLLCFLPLSNVELCLQESSLLSYKHGE